jgi:hypothetical protein
MTQPLRDFTELRGLIDVLCEETITAEQMQRLEELVRTHADAEAFYVQSMSLYADLARHFAGTPGPLAATLRNHLGGAYAEMEQEKPQPGAARKPLPPIRRRARLWLWSALGVTGLAAGLLLVLTLARRPPDERPQGEPATERLDNTVAILLQAPGAVWEETGMPTRHGAPLPPGRLLLKAGLAHIEFYSGATVILEGPADLQLISFNEAYCARGKLWATVPPQAKGFMIRSPQVDLVDQGTEFGLQVDGRDKTEVHVFQGKVDLYDSGSAQAAAARKELTTGRGLRLHGPGPARWIDSDRKAFKTVQQLRDRANAEMRRQQQKWLADSAALRRDGRLRVYYPFQADKPWDRTLLDQARGRKKPQDGAIVGCSWVIGRWPGKKALEFKQVSDRVRIHVPGEYDALTLMAWVRVDALPNRFHSLMMTDGWEEAAPHWHINDQGIIELGVQGPNRRGGAHYYSPVVFTPERLGQWCHLAVVYDRERGQVTHYVDGERIERETIKLDIPLRIGNAEIGNWTLGPRRHNHPIRFFSGCIDEFMLFGQALTEDEISRFYEQGRPPM